MTEAKVADVYYANDEQFRNVRLVAIYAESLHRVEIEPGKELLLKSSDGNLQLTGLNTICRYIGELGPRKEQLLGTDDAAKAQVFLLDTQIMRKTPGPREVQAKCQHVLAMMTFHRSSLPDRLQSYRLQNGCPSELLGCHPSQRINFSRWVASLLVEHDV